MYSYYFPLRKHSRDIINDVLNSSFSLSYNAQPSTNIKEYSDRYVLEMYLPEIDPKKVEIKINDGKVNLKYNPETTENSQEEFTWVRREFISNQEFEKEYILPEDTDGSSIKAKYYNSILCLTVNKVAQKEAQNVQIEVE